MADSTSPKPIVLNVGITGHRAGALSPQLVRALRPIVYTVFSKIRAETIKIQDSEDAFCSATAAELRLHTALASGADQIAAVCARSSGYYVRAVLPFEPQEYRNDFGSNEELDTFEQAIAAADEIVALPGDRASGAEAYVQVGASLVEAVDVLVAIWDGEQARGPGGTGEVVEMAVRSEVPVIHIEVQRESDSVRLRPLIGDTNAESWTKLSDPDLYGQVLRAAFKLAPMHAHGHLGSLGVPEDEEESVAD